MFAEQRFLPKKMELIFNKIFLKHKTEGHPERPERLAYFNKNQTETNLESGEKYLRLVYGEKYIEMIRSHSKAGLHIDADTYTNHHSFEAASHAVGSAIRAVEEEEFSLGRPPGHHANAERAMGFCLFNNIAIASQYLIEKGKKVLIIDIDGHHGNGTQDIFYDRSDVFFLSLHQFPAYPGTGWINEIGRERGEGYTINIPLPPRSGDDVFLESVNRYLPAIKKKFNPDLVGISAGFDAHHSDPLLQMNLTTNAFFNFGKIISDTFTHVFACLEGGYHLDFIHKNILAFQSGINHETNPFKEGASVTDPYFKEEFNKRMGDLEKLLSKFGF